MTMDLAFQIRKRDLGTLVNSVGSGNYGKIYEVGVSLKGFSGPFLYKEYAVEKITGIDFGVLASMIHYVNSIDRCDAEKLISLCSWPLILVVSDDATRPVGFIMQRAPEYFRKSNFPIAGYTDDYKGFQHIFTPDEQYKRATGGDSLLYTERELLLYKLTIILKELHSREIAIGDISFNNILAAIYPDYKIFLIDSDSMCFRGRSIVNQKHNETVNWYIGKWHPDELPGTYASDCYKLGLVALRLFRKNCIDYDGELPPEVPESLKRLIKASIYSNAGERPTISDWIRLLKEASITRVAQSFFAQGQDMNRQGRKQEAQAAYDKSLVLNPSLADAYLARAELRITLGDLNGAISDCKYLGRLKPGNKDAYCIKLSQYLYAHGQEETRKGNNANAITAYAKAIELNPNNADAFLARAELRMDQKDLNGAIEDYNVLAMLRPDQKNLYNNRGYCKWENKDYKGAYDDFALEITRHPIAAAFYNRAEAKRHFGDIKGAIADINQGLALDPERLTPNLKTFFDQYKHLGSTISPSVANPLSHLSAWMLSNWKLNAARKNGRYAQGMIHTPPSLVASPISLIVSWMSDNWNLNNARRNTASTHINVRMAPLASVHNLAAYLGRRNATATFSFRKYLKAGTQSKNIVILGSLLFAAVSCTALIKYDHHLAIMEEKSLVTQVRQLYDAGDYMQCVLKAHDIRVKLRKELRAESNVLRNKCLGSQHDKILKSLENGNENTKSIEIFRQLYEDLRFIANEGYTNTQLLERVQQTRELLKAMMTDYADKLYQQTARISEVVQLYQLAGDYNRAATLKSIWKEDESVFNEALDRLKRLRSPRQHNPFEQADSKPVFWFEWPTFRTVYWKNQFDNSYPQILAERSVAAAKYFMESRDWNGCIQAAEQALTMAKRIGDNNLESEAEDYRQKCTIAERLDNTP